MITAAKVAPQGLDEILSETPNDREAFKFTKKCVTAYLFSRYEKRRELAKKELERFWATPVDVHKVEENGIIYAYVEFNNIGRYILVAKYSAEGPVIEEVPRRYS